MKARGARQRRGDTADGGRHALISNPARRPAARKRSALTEKTQSTSAIMRSVPSVGQVEKCVARLVRVTGWVTALTER
jgi:hypothetical protein